MLNVVLPPDDFNNASNDAPSLLLISTTGTVTFKSTATNYSSCSYHYHGNEVSIIIDKNQTTTESACNGHTVVK
jgi:hypothetical protein